MAPNADNVHGDCNRLRGGACSNGVGFMATGTLNHHNESALYSQRREGEPAKPAAVIRKNGVASRPPIVCPDGIQRAVSDISAELSRSSEVNTAPDSNPVPSANAAEVQKAQCECCGLLEECTAAYISRVRERFCGRWICGLCAEAVNEERHRMGRVIAMEDALRVHMSLCLKFNKLARNNPALCLADALRQILRKSSNVRSNGLRSNPGSPRPRDPSVNTRGNIARSSSCIPAITRERNSGP